MSASQFVGWLVSVTPDTSAPLGVRFYGENSIFSLGLLEFRYTTSDLGPTCPDPLRELLSAVFRAQIHPCPLFR